MLGEEVEELEHGSGDAVAEALIREFLTYLLESSEALPRAKDRGGSILLRSEERRVGKECLL